MLPFWRPNPNIHLPQSLAFFLIFLCGSLSFTQAEKAFPREFRPSRANVHPITAPKNTTAAWQTSHFLFLSDEKIDAGTLQQFATTIESVPQLLKSFPLPLWSPPSNKRSIIRLCKDAQRFQSFGGPEKSTGYYDGRRREILIRADLLLRPPQSPGTRLSTRPNEDLLIHEVCHYGMSRILTWGKPWLYEGLAEYFAAAHQQGGSYQFYNTPQHIRDHFRRYLVTDKNHALSLTPLSHIIDQSGKEWITSNQFADPEDRYRPYASALLLLHYYLEGGTERRQKLRKHLLELQSYRDPRLPRPILDTEDPALIENRLRAYWSPRGIQLQFTHS